jgi:hypothetical protein
MKFIENDKKVNDLIFLFRIIMLAMVIPLIAAARYISPKIYKENLRYKGTDIEGKK